MAVLNRCGRCAQVCLILYTLLFWTSGFALLFLGIWMFVDPQRNYLLDLVNFSEGDPLLTFAAAICLVAGTFTLIVGFLGCCGALKGMRCMLVAFVLFLLVLFLAELSVGVLAIVFKEKFSHGYMTRYLQNLTHHRYNRERWVMPLVDTIQYYLAHNLGIDLRRLIRSHYGVTLDSHYNRRITVVIDKLQFYQECCGSTNLDDWLDSDWRRASALRPTDPSTTTIGTMPLVPVSCCTQLDDASARNPIARSLGRCQQQTSDDAEWRHQQGCHERLLQWFDMHTIIFASVGFSFAIFQLIGMLIAICLCRQITDYYYIGN